MKGFLVDTCAISEFTKPAPNLGLVQWLSRVDPHHAYMSAVTIGELRYGISVQADVVRRGMLEEWLRAEVLADFENRVLAFDADVAERWGRLRAAMRVAGTPVPVLDAMIAATALHYNLAVVTRNEPDFYRLGVDIVNPWK